jgi:hypothetical protein
MENRLLTAQMLFGGLSAKVQEWQATLSSEEASDKIENLMLSLSNQEFDMVVDLMEILATKPGRRLTGDSINLSAIRKKLKALSIKRMPVN